MLILGVINIPWYILWPLGLVLSVLLYFWYKKRFFSRLGVPSPPCSLLMGDLTIMAKRGFFYIDADYVKNKGKVFGIYLGNVPELIINDTDIIKQIMVKDFSKFSERAFVFPIAEKNMLAVTFAEGAHWKYLRMLLGPSFTSGKLRKMEKHILRCLDSLRYLVDENIASHPDGFNIYPLLENFTLDVMCSVGFGHKADAQRNPDDDFVKHVKSILNVDIGKNFFIFLNLLLPDLKIILKYFPVAFDNEAMYNKMRDAVHKFSEARQASDEAQKDLLQLMFDAHKNEELSEVTELPQSVEEFKKRGLTEEEIVMNSIIFLSAGYDTTGATLTWMVYEMVLNPECQEKLTKEIDENIGNDTPSYDNVNKLVYLDMVVNETLRMHPPCARINRAANEDMEIKGVKIPKGLDCTVAPLALHYLPEYWDSPTQFNPERFAPENQANLDPYAFMPFGLGPRSCIGLRLALMELKMTVISLLQRYRFSRTPDLKVPMPVQRVITLKPAEQVLVKVERRAMTS